MGAVHHKRVHTLFTPLALRGKGYSTKLVQFMTANHLATNALCTKESYNIFLKNGFELKRIIERTNRKGESYTLYEVKYGTTQT